MHPTDPVDDRQLIDAFASHDDQTAFGEIVERHARWIFAAAFRQLGDRQLAEDAVQVVFVLLAQKAHTMNTRQKLSGWLFNTLQFTVKNFRRAERSRRKHEANAAKPVLQEPPPDSAMVRECAEQVDTAVARLPKAYRQAILLRFYQDLPFDQIALELGMKEAAARKRVDRALQGLRKHLSSMAPTASILSAAMAYGLDQSPPSLIPAASEAALAGNAAGTLAPAVSAAAKQVAYLMAIAKVQVAALVAFVCLSVAVPATVVTWREIAPSIGPAQTDTGSNSIMPATTAPSTTIGGIVRNQGGQPLDAVRIHLEWETTIPGKHGGPPQPAMGRGDVRTDANGRWKYSSVYLSDSSKPTLRLERADYGADEDAEPISGKLSDQTAVFVMTHGIQVSGAVVNQSGSPIRGAKISTIEVRYVVNDPGKTVTADAEGHFAFPPRAAGTISLTTTARGYAPDLQRITVAEGMSPVRIVLSPGKTIRARVVDENGKPIRDAMVRAFSWRQMNSLQWTGRTDSDGRFIMHDAPEDAIEFEIFKEGYQMLVNASLTAGDGESTVTMSSEPTVRGTVTDADTGKAIPRFEIIPGMALRAGSPPFYQFSGAKEFSDGMFELPVSGHNEVTEYYLRVEADGYAPVITSPFLTSTSFKLALHRSQEVRGSVVGPDGKPVVAAQVILALPGSQVDLSDNHLRIPDMVRVVETNSNGEFHFRPQTGKFHLLALCEAGYALEVFDQPPQYPVELKISPWAKIDASYSPGKARKKSNRVNASIIQIRRDRDNYVNYEFQYTAAIAAGRLTLDKVPSFDGNLVELGIFPNSGGGTYERRWIPMRLAPGQTTQPDLRGATIVGSLTSPDGQSAVRTGFVGLTPLMEPPARNWPIDWSKESGLPPPLYDFHGSGHFQITGVRPGRYLYETAFGDAPIYFRASGTLEVHAGDVGTTIDMGNLVCEPLPLLEVGQPAPRLLGHTLDETPIALHDFAGKLVLGVMWDSNFPESDSAMPLLAALGKEFADNPHVALLALNLDAIDTMEGVIHRPGTLKYPGWMNGYIGQMDRAMKFQLLLRDRPAIFIVGPDGKLLARDVSAKDAAKTLRHFLAPTTIPSTK
ncbi:MAG: sigma-70 family RNA polymerase sigma factor [Tepidisphaeraceae bacterium]|jgi:RNA polymerase sigma factor (sigma-70 family)